MRRLHLFLWAPLLVVGALFVAAVPAGAAGNARLNALIISNPVQGWNPVPRALTLEEAASPLEGLRGNYKGKGVAASNFGLHPRPS